MAGRGKKRRRKSPSPLPLPPPPRKQSPRVWVAFPLPSRAALNSQSQDLGRTLGPPEAHSWLVVLICPQLPLQAAQGPRTLAYFNKGSLSAEELGPAASPTPASSRAQAPSCSQLIVSSLWFLLGIAFGALSSFWWPQGRSEKGRIWLPGWKRAGWPLA